MTDPKFDSLNGAVEAIKSDVEQVKAALVPLSDGKWVPAEDIPAGFKLAESASRVVMHLAVAGAAAWAALSGALSGVL